MTAPFRLPILLLCAALTGITTSALGATGDVIIGPDGVRSVDKGPSTSGGDSGGSTPYNGPNLWNMLRNAKEKSQQQRIDAALAANHEGVEFTKKGDWARAVPCFQAAVAKSPGDEVMRNNLTHAQSMVANEKALAFSRQYDWAKAAVFFQEALQKEPFEQNRAVIKENLTRAKTEIAAQNASDEKQRLADQADKERDKAAASQMRQAMQTVAQTITRPPGDATGTHVSGSLEFGDPLTGDAFGSKKSNPKLTPAEARKVGSNTKAVDQLKSAAAQGAKGGDLTVNYDVGGGPNAGTLTPHTLGAGAPPMDLSRFSDRAKKDPRVITSLDTLSELQSKRLQLDSQRTQLTKERNQAKDADSTKELTERLNQKEKDFQANLVAITQQTAKIEKLHREIDNSVDDTPASTPGQSLTK